MTTDRLMDIEPFILGIHAQGFGAIGMVLSFVVTYAVSRMTEEPPAEIQEFAKNICYPRGAGARLDP